MQASAHCGAASGARGAHAHARTLLPALTPRRCLSAPPPPRPGCHRYETQRHALFFTDPDARRFYKNHVAFLINRNNSING